MVSNLLAFEISKDQHLSHSSPSQRFSLPHNCTFTVQGIPLQLSRQKVKMSELSAETNPQILVNGKQQEQLQQRDDAEEQISQAKMQSVFKQVREQIRAQVCMAAPKSSIVELVQKVKERETQIALTKEELEVTGDCLGEKTESEVLTDENKGEGELKPGELCAFLEEKLATTEKTLRVEFEEKISKVCKEMQAYTDKVKEDLECKMQSQNPIKQPQEKSPDKKHKPPATFLLAGRRGRILARTMTTIIPKTCAPVIIGPRAKSETLCTSKGGSSRVLQRDPVTGRPGNKPCQCRNVLPPVGPPLHQRKKPMQTKTHN